MRYLLALADAIDWATEYLGQWLKWLVLFSSLVSAFNALMRYAIHYSSNAWLEIQWYMFGAMFLLAAGYALKHGEHVRVDVFFSKLSPPMQAWVDVVGTILFFLIAVVIVRGDRPLVVGGRSINVYPPANPISVAYALFFVRLVSWWRASRDFRTGLDEGLTQLLSWHFWPVAIFFLMPKHLSAYLWYMSPGNSGPGLHSTWLERTSFYANHAVVHYHQVRDSWAGVRTPDGK